MKLIIDIPDSIYETIEADQFITREQLAVLQNDILKGKRVADRPHGKWIPVSKRLPEEKINPKTRDFEEVLCTTIWGDVRHYKFGKPIGLDKPHFWYGWGIMDKEVIAWQPLPEPYKEADNDK